MPRRTRKNKRHSRKKTHSRSARKSRRKNISLLENDADLHQVIAKLNTVINLCCLGQHKIESPGRVLTGLDPRMLDFSPAPSSGSSVKLRRSSRLAKKAAKAAHKPSTKKRGKNEFFTKMLAAKKAKAPSFEYRGTTYKATKGGNAGQLTVYKKA